MAELGSANNGNANTTISYPGLNWQMIWTNGAFDNVQLDIVGFLAVLGEGAVLANYQVSALSPLLYLPRVIPAPQALLPPTRPTELPSARASVTGVYSGNTKEHVHHIAHVLLGEALPTFTVRCVEVTKKRQPKSIPTLNRVKTLWTTKRPKDRNPTWTTPAVTAKLNGPLTYVILTGFFLALSLFTLSVIFGDGMSMIATILLSSLSTLTGIANKWQLRLPQRPKGDAPPGDTVIRYPNGSYLVVRCEEDVARELYFAPEEIEYNIANPAIYRMISLLGTIMLMLGIIALANSKLQLQFAWAASYMIINAAHWVVAALPQRLHWDLSSYHVREEGISTGPNNPNFTEALWKAIILTKSTRWIRNGKAAPQTPVWDQWLHEAESRAQEVEAQYGFPIEPLWPNEQGEKVPVWIVPEDWSPKSGWNEISNEHEEPKVRGLEPSVELA